MRSRLSCLLCIAPLGVPAEAATIGPDDLQRFAAARLFVQRAHEVQPTLQLDAAAAYEIAGICRQLDGLPLAIELAAARVKHLPLAALRERLQRRLEILTGGWPS